MTVLDYDTANEMVEAVVTELEGESGEDGFTPAELLERLNIDDEVMERLLAGMVRMIDPPVSQIDRVMFALMNGTVRAILASRIATEREAYEYEHIADEIEAFLNLEEE